MMDLKKIVQSRCIGLTGGIATGKSSIASILKGFGLVVFDADQFARQAVLPGSAGLEEIFHIFGEVFKQADGSLNRAMMRRAIFNDTEKRMLLENILHPKIEQVFLDALAASSLPSSKEYFFYEAALLFKNDRHKDFFEIWLSSCSHSAQLERLMKRDQLQKIFAENLLANQYDYHKLSHFADLVVDTDCSLEELKIRVKQLVISRLSISI